MLRMKRPETLRMLAWGLAALVLLTIFALTLQTPSQTMAESSRVQEWLIEFFERMGHAPAWIYDMHEVRSRAHIPEYFALAAALFIALRSSAARPGVCAALSFLISSLTGLLDETLKIFLPTREFDARDLLFDVIGSFAAAVFMFTLVSLFRRRKDQ